MSPVRAAAIFVLPLCAVMLTGCDRLTGTAEQRIADAEAVGYACRVSGKSPEDCMKENESFSPSDILDGWKNAAQDIKDKVVSEGGVMPPPGAGEGGNKPAEEKPLEKPLENPTKDSVPADAQKPADAKGSSR